MHPSAAGPILWLSVEPNNVKNAEQVIDLVAVGSEEEEAQMEDLPNDGNVGLIVKCIDPYHPKYG